MTHSTGCDRCDNGQHGTEITRTVYDTYGVLVRKYTVCECCSATLRNLPTHIDGNALLDVIADILYPLDGFKGDQWNGGDVCDALAALLDQYRPDAKDRQPEHPLADWERELLADERSAE